MKFHFLKIIGLVFLLVGSSQIGFSQIRIAGLPESFQSNEKSATIIPSIILDSIHPGLLNDEDFDLGISNRFGKVQSIEINIKEQGIQTKIKGKGTIWRYQLNAPDALSLGIQFSSFHIPSKASLYIYNESKDRILGAFTSLNNKRDNYFAVSDFQGKEAIVEYFEPDSVEYSGEVIIGGISMAYKSVLEAAANSKIGINCSEGSDWQVQKNSVCMITFVDGRYSYVCSGSLLNNVRGDGTPYFLTANHCISSNTSAKTVIAYFNYEDSSCNSTDATLNHSLSGATLKANNATSDFCLLILNEGPPEAYSPYFAGWDATGNNPQSGVCIHHPNSKSKSIAISNSKVAGNSELITWDDKSVSAINSHWDVNFSEGTTESGSSGSPFFNQDKRVVGQLHGGGNTESLFGKFSISWASNSLASKQLKVWLDPDNTGTRTLDGFKGKSAPVTSFASQMTVACVNNAVQLNDKSWYSPTKWLWHISPRSYLFVQSTDSSSQNPIVEFLREGTYSVELISSNNYGSDSTTMTNYIDVRNSLPVQFISMPADTTICGCDLVNLPLVASGAYNYSFSISDNSYLSTTVRSDTLALSLKSNAEGVVNFSTIVTVQGTHGSCLASDSLVLHVTQQKNDNIADAISLNPGRNGVYSNHCGTVESNEPIPKAGNCYSQVSWCSGETGGTLNNTVWFSFYAPSNGKITIDTHGFDDQIAIYKSSSGKDTFTDFNDLDQVAANDNRSSSDLSAEIEDLEVEPGARYWIQMDGRNAAFGDATIDLISNSAEVYPTVSNDGLFTLYFSSSVEGTANYEIYNTLGQIVLSNSFGVSPSSNPTSLDLRSCAKGIYYLTVRMGDIKSTHKIAIR
jgi:PKD repeat protein